ncbi:beta-galactosidase [Catenovulum maritimum]|uniref:Agarase n=1 Tax=Catenovulum maritimum TaxID=1513271 RepID=A0A0J8H011_9ALTE|nr:beta-galactosidase [Catenovulum maritimum]AYW35322.1 agarase Q5 [Catenovulum maritimum]KMT66819.1 agarase [Catenovulum maritimum]
MKLKKRYLASLVAVLTSQLSGCNNLNNQEKESQSSQVKMAEVVLFDFEKGQVPDGFEFWNAASSVTDKTSAIDGNHSLLVKVNTLDNNSAGMRIKPEKAFDWSEYQDFNLAFDLTNAGTESLQIDLTISDENGGFYTRGLVVPVGKTQTFYAKMDGHDQQDPPWATQTEFNFASGLRSNPVTWQSDDKQVYSFWGKKRLDISAITAINFSANGLLSDRQFTVDNIRLRANPKMDENFLVGLIDEFGQNAKVDYPNKVKSDAHLKQMAAEELASLNAELMDDRTKFHGWKSGPRFAATGYFRTEKIEGKWALIDPEGYLYFSSGIDIIRLSNSSTLTGYDFDQNLVEKRTADMTVAEDDQPLNPVSKQAQATRYVANQTRKDLFNWLPDYNDSLGNHYGYRRETQSGPLKHGETFSFYSANLERRYGETYPESYLDTWRQVTLRRMLDWGYTSLGNWSESSYYGNNQIPFVAFADIIGDFGTLSSGFDFWHGVPDAYDPKFKQRAVAAAKHVAAQINATPWCMGVFLDNEQSFGRGGSDESRYGIVLNTLTRDAKEVHAKAAFTQSLKNKYKTISALNKAWQKDIASWQAFAAGIDASFNTEQQKQDYSELLYQYGVQYFGTVNAALKSVLPNHLYLGSRLPVWGMPLEIVKAAAENSDVITYNLYEEGLVKGQWDFLAEVDAPSLIGEFSFGADDAGHVHPGIVISADQKDRAEQMKKYMHSIIDNPYFVGVHMFQYADGPITGRAYDGENYNTGIVRVTDVPYEHMVEAAKDVHQNLYQRRYGYLLKD